MFCFLSEIPTAEKFSFCLNSLLSDIAVGCPESRDEIIVNQVEVLTVLTNMIKTSRESSNLPPIILCKATVPLLLGLGRSMGRYATTDPPLLCRLFPRDEIPVLKTPEQPADSKSNNTISQFRSIIPRSMSGSLTAEITEEKSPKNNKKKLNSFYSVPYDQTTYFFSKYGSSFNQFPNMRFCDSPEKKNRLQFPINHLQTIFALAKKLLTKETLEHLDEQAGDIYSLHQIKPYGYKSFSETINLVMVTLLREILQNQSDLPTPFTKDVQEFVKRLFLIGQTELQNKQHDSTVDKVNDPSNSVVNKYKINVMANAACVDLLVWAIGDETGEFLLFVGFSDFFLEQVYFNKLLILTISAVLRVKVNPSVLQMIQRTRQQTKLRTGGSDHSESSGSTNCKRPMERRGNISRVRGLNFLFSVGYLIKGEGKQHVGMERQKPSLPCHKMDTEWKLGT